MNAFVFHMCVEVRPFSLYQGQGHLSNVNVKYQVHISQKKKKKMAVAGTFMFYKHILFLLYRLLKVLS